MRNIGRGSDVVSATSREAVFRIISGESPKATSKDVVRKGGVEMGCKDGVNGGVRRT